MLTLTHGPAGLHLGSSAEDGTVLCESVGRSVVSDSVTLWTVARQALVSVGFSRQECWSGLLFPSPGDLHRSGIEPASAALAGGFLTPKPPGKPEAMVGL